LGADAGGRHRRGRRGVGSGARRDKHFDGNAHCQYNSFHNDDHGGADFALRTRELSREFDLNE
jgi:hypothetical protein